MRIRHIEIFHAVMQAGTVQGAASMLHITQPAATRRLQQAEAYLGVALFQRTRGRLVPTEEALHLLPDVEQLYLRLEQVRRVASTLSRGLDAQLRVLSAPALAIERLPRALGDWRRRQPNVRLALRTLHSRQIAESIALREAHVGFAFDASSHPAVISEPIASGRLVCVGADLKTSVLPVSALADHPVIDLDPADPLGSALHAACRAEGVVPNANAVVQTYHAAIELSAQGFGWALVDSYTAAYAQRYPQLRVAALAPEIPVTVYALRSRDMPANAAAGSLIECLAATLAQ